MAEQVVISTEELSAPPQGIYAGEAWTPEQRLRHCLIRFQDGKIATIESDAHPSGDNIIDASDAIVIPGLVDLQVNGALGWSFQAEHRAHFGETAEFHRARGTTTFLPTLVSAPEQVLLASLATLADLIESSTFHLPGIHLEGPFLAPERRGAHEESALRLPHLDFTRRLVQAARGHLKLVTLAPELPGALQVIDYLHTQGIRVAAGHTNATFDEMRRAVSAGLSMVTHTGNQSDWPHRAVGTLGFMASEPGSVGALLAIPELGGSVIMDGYHFHPALLQPLLRLKTPSQLFLVSDAATAAGCPPGDYDQGGLNLTVHPAGFATSRRGGNVLAGSMITLFDALRRAVELAGVSFPDAVAMASRAPARYLGIDPQAGQIAVGANAHLLIVERNLQLRQVIALSRS